MQATTVSNAIDLWEAWIDFTGAGESYMLYVIGDVCTGKSKTIPVLAKKQVQGLATSHLMLEVLPGLPEKEGRLAEVRYAEHIGDLNKYRQISICAGEEVIASIMDIELVC